MSAHEQRHGDYLISADPARLNARAIHAYLSRSYWATDIPFAVVEQSLQHSLGIGAYTAQGEQVGLVRVITDHATYAYLCDVYVLEEHRRHGLAKAMLALTMNHPRLQRLRSWNLRTRDAHATYAPWGFQAVDNPASYMIRRSLESYQSKPAGS